MVQVAAEPARAGSSYVEWGAVIAGAVAATAISFILLTAGAAVGLSVVSPYPGQSNGSLVLYLAAFWSIFTPILALLIGGYIAGRMRSPWGDATANEVQFRDGVHGLLVWSVSIMAGALLAFMAATTAAQSGVQLTAAALNDRDTTIAPAVNSMLNSMVVAQAEPISPASSTTRAATPTTTPAAARPAGEATAETRGFVTRTLAVGVANGGLSELQRQMLAQIVSDRTGLSQAEAQKRVDQSYAEAVRAVDTARKAAVLAGLVTASALLVGLLAAWFAAQGGGNHRDENIPVRFTWISRRRLTPPPRD